MSRQPLHFLDLSRKKENKFVQPNDCTYICYRLVADKINSIMRRDVFQAIADPTRRDIIVLIAKKTMTPNTVADSFDLSRQAISKHINILLECGLLSLNIEGREYYYSIEPKKLAEVNDWLDPFRKMWEDRFTKLDKVLNNLKSKKNGK
jgi:DNA-binding transcriptional ArsR family regulator